CGFAGAWLAPLPSRGSESFALSQIFDVLGVPRLLSTDNGAGFAPQRHASVTNLMAYAFRRGVHRIQFIPPGSPTHNSFIERLHRTVKHTGGAYHLDLDSEHAAHEWMYHNLLEYNRKRHTGIGGRGRNSYQTPARLHGDNYNPATYSEYLTHDAHAYRYSLSELASTPGTISFLRMIHSESYATNAFPQMCWIIDGQCGGHMSRIDHVYGGSGRVYFFDQPAENGGSGRLIGEFNHSWGVDHWTSRHDVFVVRLVVDDIQPRGIDDTLYRRLEIKNQRKGSTANAQVTRSGGYYWRPDPVYPEHQLLYNSRGVVVMSTMSAGVPDHVEDFL
ncbi:MAG: transposase family protein, partial [Chloroflexaceae bacterium]|nr:transposase family protein [Chloroflexaceae bacterium]